MTEIPVRAPEIRAVRTVGDAETLKALADPLRLALLTALMRASPDGLRVMSVKELAEELGEPQTKLYRHVKQLEAANLIRVAASRMVSGILEHRYQACQRDLRFGRDLIREQGTADDASAVLGSLFDAYRDRFFAAYLQDQRAGPGSPRGPEYRKPVLSIAEIDVSEARAAELHDRVRELIGELREPAAGEQGSVPVHALIAFYCAAEPGSQAGQEQDQDAQPGQEHDQDAQPGQEHDQDARASQPPGQAPGSGT